MRLPWTANLYGGSKRRGQGEVLIPCEGVTLQDPLSAYGVTVGHTSVVVLLRWAAELHHNCSLTPSKGKGGENMMKRAQELRQEQGVHSTIIVKGKTSSEYGN